MPRAGLKSTQMHYRHGCVIVRGGKIIGQGHNGYRPGFDGDLTLKTGKLAVGASNSPAIMALKQRNKAKSEQCCRSGDSRARPLATAKSDVLGASRSANVPLSQHSEMAAISSALSLSSHTASCGSARSTGLMQKPGYLKLPGRGKRESRLRNLNAYVEAICDGQISDNLSPATVSTGSHGASKLCVQGSQFEPSSSQCGQEGGTGVQFKGGERERERPAAHTQQCCERPQDISAWCPPQPSKESPSPPPYLRKFTATKTGT